MTTVSEAQQMMDAYDASVKLLAEKHIGKAECTRGLTQPTVRCRKRWYIRQIRMLAGRYGALQSRLRRCKCDGTRWKEYVQVQYELEMLMTNLELDLLDL